MLPKIIFTQSGLIKVIAMCYHIHFNNWVELGHVTLVPCLCWTLNHGRLHNSLQPWLPNQPQQLSWRNHSMKTMLSAISTTPEGLWSLQVLSFTWMTFKQRTRNNTLLSQLTNILHAKLPQKFSSKAEDIVKRNIYTVLQTEIQCTGK